MGEQNIRIEGDVSGRLAPRQRGDERGKFFGGHPDLNAVAIAKVDLPARILQLHGADLRAQSNVFHVGHVHTDKALVRLAVEGEIECKVDGAAQNGAERLRKAVRRRERLLFGRARGGLVGIVFEIVLICCCIRAVGAVFIDRMIVGRTLCVHTLRGGICLLDLGREHLPCRIKRVGDRDIFKRGKGRKPPREHHLIDVVCGRLVGGGVEIVCLRIGSVAVVRDGRGIQKRLLVDDIDGKFRAGKPARRLVLLHRHIAVGRALLPGGVDAVIGGRAARRLAPDDAIPHPAELFCGVDEAGCGDVRLDENAVRELLPGIDLLREHGIHRSRHLGIPYALRTEPRVHIADIFERRMKIGGRAVRRKFIQDGREALLHGIGCSLVEEQCIDPKGAPHQDGARRSGGKPLYKTAVMLRLEPQPALFVHGLRDIVAPERHHVLRILTLSFYLSHIHIPRHIQHGAHVIRLYDNIVTQ